MVGRLAESKHFGEDAFEGFDLRGLVHGGGELCGEGVPRRKSPLFVAFVVSDGFN